MAADFLRQEQAARRPNMSSSFWKKGIYDGIPWANFWPLEYHWNIWPMHSKIKRPRCWLIRWIRQSARYWITTGRRPARSVSWITGEVIFTSPYTGLRHWLSRLKIRTFRHVLQSRPRHLLTMRKRSLENSLPRRENLRISAAIIAQIRKRHQGQCVLQGSFS